MPLIEEDWRALTATERDVLTVLALGGEANGHTVHEHLRGDAPTTRSTTLRALHSLEDKGLVKSGPHRGPKGKIIRLTGEGWSLVYASVVNVGEDILADEPR